MRVMILAAGRGERMRPLTDHTPKPLLVVGGKPLIVWHIERCVRAGLSEIVINHAWLGHQIEETLGDGKQYGARLSYSAESTALETAGGIANALPLLGTDPFLVVNGDIWCDWNVKLAKGLGEQLERTCKDAWLLLVDNPAHHPSGDFYLDDAGLVHGSSQQCTNRINRLTFAGIGIYRPELFLSTPPDRPTPLAPLLREAMSGHRVIGSHYRGDWTDVGTPERLAQIDLKLSHSS